MKKSILIIGKENSGKSFLSQFLSTAINSSEVCFIGGYYQNLNKNPFCFVACDEKTKIVVVDDLNIIDDLEWLVSLIKSKQLVVRKPCQEDFTINPLFIINVSPDKKIMDFMNGFIAAYEDLFEIINLSEPIFLENILELKKKVRLS